MRDLKIYFIIGGILLGIYLIAEYNKPAPVNWTPTLYYGDKIPMGTYATYHQLNDIFPKAKVTKTDGSFYAVFHDDSLKQGNYLVIANKLNVNKNDFTELVKFIKTGNSVFISSFSFESFLADTLKIVLGFEYKKGNSTLSFVNKQLQQPAGYSFKRDICNQYFKQFDTARATVIGINNYGDATLLSYKFGKGSLYLCANPGVFGNYSMLSPSGAAYVEKALSYLPEANNVYWDEYQNGDIAANESPVRVFFNSPALQWAYYISLFGLLIFVLYEIKRRQRVIPVVAPPVNATLEFVNVVGQVYYETRNNANIANKKIIYLLEYIRDKYRIKTNNPGEEFIDTLTVKMGIDRVLAAELVRHIHKINAQGYVSDRELIELNTLIDKFYKQSA